MLLAYGYGYGMGLYFDRTYILVLIGAVITLWASYYVKATYNKYSHVMSRSGYTGAEVAERILRSNGIYDVRIQHISGDLTDNYNPKTKVLSLSDTTYASRSVAALGVAAHECGHAIQHERSYAPITVRRLILPFANLGAKLSWILIVLGLIINGGNQTLLNAGIFAFSLVVIFQVATLPVEFDASKRAVKILGDSHILANDELTVTKKVLNAAALTYVAAVASSLLQLIRLIMLFSDNNRRRG